VKGGERGKGEWDDYMECKDRHKTVTGGLNFINVLCTAFTRSDPESVKLY